MKKLFIICTSILLISLSISPCLANSSDEKGNIEIITSITLSGFLAVGVEVAWGFTDNLGVKFGLSAGADLFEELSPLLWFRAHFLHKLNPQDPVTFYGGEGIDYVIAFTELNMESLVFVGLTGGVEYTPFEVVSLIGEGRFGVPLLGKRYNAFIVPLGLTIGGALII